MTPSPRGRRGTCRATVALGTLLAGLVMLAPSATASENRTAKASNVMPAQVETQARVRSAALTELERKVVVLQQRALQAQAASQDATDQVTVLEGRVTTLNDQAALASENARSLYGQLASDTGGIVTSVSQLLGIDDSVAQAEAAADVSAHAQKLVTIAEQGLAEARIQARDALRAWRAAESEAARTGQEITARVAAEVAARQADFRPGYRVSDPAQDRRNRAALQAWHGYLAALGEAGVLPPAAEALENPNRLPRPFTAQHDRKGRFVPGVAVASKVGSRPLTVLPAETIRAVSAAFSRVGLPDAAATVGTDAYACGGLTRQAWTTGGVALPADSVDQWESLATVRGGQLQVGDLVFLGDETVGLHQAGVYVGDRLFITSDPKEGEVGVRAIPARQMYGAKRVPLTATRATPAPEPAGVPTGCGELAVNTGGAGATASGTPGSAQAVWTHPLADEGFSMSAPFGAGGSLWSSGEHSGQDFAAAEGTPVYAARGGIVTVEQPDWAGNLVRIDHGAGVETWYAHLSRVVVQDGEQVPAGAVIGAVGNEGNSTGPHLHFEVRLDGVAVDPMLLLSAGAVLTTWGGFANGEVPASELCPATSDGQLLRCDAAVAYRLMEQAFLAETGTPLCITDSYRSRAGQEQLYLTKPDLAAVPGTSNHGLGLAVDLCGGVEQFGTAEHQWVVTNGPRFGWVHPDWAAAGGSRPEPWHFEFGGIGTSA
jgi:murein DD-endopeptidase MepM/ murein hydrolase activator NlpD